MRTRQGCLLLGVLVSASLSPLHAEAPATDRYGDPLPAGAVARLGSARMQCRWNIVELAFSPDGKQVAAGTCNPAEGAPSYGVELWDVRGRRELRRFGGDKLPAAGFAFSPDGKTLV